VVGVGGRCVLFILGVCLGLGEWLVFGIWVFGYVGRLVCR